MSTENNYQIPQEKNFISLPTPELNLPKELFSPVNNTYNSLQQCRIIQKHLVYIIGLSINLINKDSQLKNFEYFGQYGKIVKLVTNKNKTYNNNGPNGPSYSCYVTYSNQKESSLAILALDNAIIDKHIIKASYGTTKYCLNFLRNSVCLNKDCLYLHHLADKDDIVSRDEMNNNKNIFANQHILAIKLSDICSESKRIELEGIKNIKTIFPNVYTVYNKDIVQSYIKLCQNNNNKNFGDVCKKIINDENNISVENNNDKNNNDNDNNNNDNNNNNNEKNNKIEIGKTYLTINSLHKIFSSRDRSRFSFVNDKNNLNSLYKIDVPISIQNFISEKLNHSKISQKETNDIIDYYFSNSYKSNDKWDYLISTLNMWKEFEEYPNGNCHKIAENENYILIDKFNTN